MAQSLGSFAADAPRYGVEPADAYYALNGAAAGPTAGVTSIQGESGVVTLASADGSVVFTTPTPQSIDLSVPTAAPLVPSPAGTYIDASITVDANGRVTSASSAAQAAVALIYNGTTSGSASGGGVNYAGGSITDATPGDGNYKILHGSLTVAPPQLINGTAPFPMINGHLYRVSISGYFSGGFSDSAFTGTIQIGLTTDPANNVAISDPNSYALWTSPTGTVFPQLTAYQANFSSSFLVLGKGQSPALYVAGLGTALPTNGNLYTVGAARGSTFSYEDLGLWSGASAVPAQPTALASSEISTTAFKVSWTQAAPAATANSYTLNGTVTVPTIDASINNPTGPYAYFTGLTTGTPYTVVVTPQNNLGVGTPSAGLVVTTL